MKTMAAAVVVVWSAVSVCAAEGFITVDDFDRPNNLYHGDGWESINPGYWQIREKALARRLENVGDRSPSTSFPWHWRNRDLDKEIEPTSADRDPSLPMGMIWRRDWVLSGEYAIRIEATVKSRVNVPEPEQKWNNQRPGYGVLGLTFGGKSLYESRGGGAEAACLMAVWQDNDQFVLGEHRGQDPRPLPGAKPVDTPKLKAGDRVVITVEVSQADDGKATVLASFESQDKTLNVGAVEVETARVKGYLGLVARGNLDFEVNEVDLVPGENKPLFGVLNELHSCYPLGDTLREVDGQWHCTFVALFRNDGENVQVRVSDSPDPEGGWERVPVAGSAPIVNNEWRRFTASIDVQLPKNPADGTQYYTVWKDGVDVTADPREGFLGRLSYVGRLPQLRAPYRVCGLGGHAIIRGNANLPEIGAYEKNWIHDQPTPDAYKYFEDYDFQIIAWDDDVWYLELNFPPPSTDDAYKIITLSICGPTTRWQMMRHWNVLNPGDHDYGMDDVKGPEQLAVRLHDDLGQDSEYMQRNFKIVQHVVRGHEDPSGVGMPKDWRRWHMPNGDFSLVVLNARLWRTSQDTDFWTHAGWGGKKNLNDRTLPTRTLLGEEQFAWLQELIRTDPSPLMCFVGINNLHPVFGGHVQDPETGLWWNQRDRVAADYAGWAKAGCDRVIDLFGSRQGVVSVYGDIHLASILRDEMNRFYECSFGPIGRTGSRRVKHDFGPTMTDYDGREVTVHALYHSQYQSPDLQPRKGPTEWNFLEMTYDPRGDDPRFSLKVRNIIDPPEESPRGGGFVEDRASNTGRPVASVLPETTTLPHALVTLAHTDGRPIRGIRSTAEGSLPLNGLIDVEPGTTILLQAYDGDRVDSQVLTTISPPAGAQTRAKNPN